MLTDLSQRLLTWYYQNARSLPWRMMPSENSGEQEARQAPSPDSYPIWVSEVMLQQTQVETVIPYFHRWLERFPTLWSLAAASEQEVLSLWEGLGYYSRARNLHKAARQVVSENGGQMPSNRKALERLPGIGQYTAAAIASIAFGQNEPTLDGNIRRVLARLFNVRLAVRSPGGEKQLWEIAQANLPLGKAGDYNQALMDLGAMICSPHNPKCGFCPLSSLCQAHLLGVQEEVPLIQPRPPRPHYIFTAGVLYQQGQILITHRPSKGLLGGLWEFPGGKLNEGEDLPGCLQRILGEKLGVVIDVGANFGLYQHGYTHFLVTLHAFHCQVLSGEPYPFKAPEVLWVEPSELKNFPMGKIDRQIADKIEKSWIDGKPNGV